MSTATARYDHDGLQLNVTVDRDKDGCTVECITAGRDTQDIAHLLSKATIDSIAEFVDAQLAREARLEAEQQRIARFEQRLVEHSQWAAECDAACVAAGY